MENENIRNHKRSYDRTGHAEGAVQSNERRTGTTGTLNLQNTRWAGMLVLTVVIGSIMSYGLIAFLFGLFTRESAVSMVFIIIPMTVLMFLSMHVILGQIQKKMNVLTDAIDKVAAGDLTVQIPTQDAEEYTAVYEEFNAMVRELARTREEMQAFTNEFAHEFKTPITSINGFAEYLTETGKGVESEERMQYLSVIRDQSKRLQNLSMNTLLLSKMEAMQIVTDKETYNLGEQLRHCAILLLPSMEAKHIRLDIPENFDFYFTGNKEMMEHVWINLINNAVKFTPEGGIITIAETQGPGPSHQSGGKQKATAAVVPADHSGSAGQICSGKPAPQAGRENVPMLCVSVSDTGCGMDEDTINHIFEKYYQNDTKSLAKGNGIGLSIVERVVDLHHGRIEVTSTPGEGSTFRVHLPEH